MLEEALLLNAKWLAFIDDDQTAWPSWLERHLIVASRDKADVVQARVIVTYPEPAPFCAFPGPRTSSMTPQTDRLKAAGAGRLRPMA